MKKRELDDLVAFVEEQISDIGRSCGEPIWLSDEDRAVAWLPAIKEGIKSALWGVASLAPYVDSPIEERFLVALVAIDELSGPSSIDFHGHGIHHVVRTSRESSSHLVITGQAPVGQYRADFLLEWGFFGMEARVAVELDGHDFHEKTKEQVARGKKRDRFFAAQDLPLLRFSGSEVHKDATACAQEALALLSSAHNKAIDRRRAQLAGEKP